MEVGGGSRAHFVVARPRAPLSSLLHHSYFAINARFSVIVECLSLRSFPCQQSSLVSQLLETGALCIFGASDSFEQDPLICRVAMTRAKLGPDMVLLPL